MPNKKCYIVGGLGCSGKSTFAQKLASQNNIPYIKADDIYFIVQQNLGVSNEVLPNLPMEQTWKNPEKYGIDVGVYKTMANCVKQAYLEYFSYNIPSSFVIEGEAIFYNHLEYEVLMELLSGWDKRFLCLQPNYEQWLKNRSKRITEGGTVPLFRDNGEYTELCREYLTYLPQQTIIIKDILNTDCTLMGTTEYQSNDFSDPKWAVFNFPVNMQGKKFLDISCNTGWFSKKASECGAKVAGLDIAWPLLDVALDRVPNGQFVLTRVEDFNFYDKFDFVLCSSAFHYYQDRERLISDIASITDYFVLELPLLKGSGKNIVYQSEYQENFCALCTEELILSWLNKYFKKVEKIGETIQPNGDNRPVYKCTN